MVRHCGPMRHARQFPRSVRPHEVDCWLFDLDNTLYPADCNLFAQIDVRMGEYISTRLGVDRSEARRIQKAYYFQYGMTLRGLMLEHRIEPQDYLEFVHDIDISVVPPAPALDRALAALPGRKVVFTNGSTAHAERILAQRGIRDRFDRIFDIESCGFLPKPMPEPYDHVLGELGIDGPAIIFFEDSPANLRPAAERGMTTVWVKHGRADLAHGAENPHERYADHITDDLEAWLVALTNDG